MMPGSLPIPRSTVLADDAITRSILFDQIDGSRFAKLHEAEMHRVRNFDIAGRSFGQIGGKVSRPKLGRKIANIHTGTDDQCRHMERDKTFWGKATREPQIERDDSANSWVTQISIQKLIMTLQCNTQFDGETARAWVRLHLAVLHELLRAEARAAKSGDHPSSERTPIAAM